MFSALSGDKLAENNSWQDSDFSKPGYKRRASLHRMTHQAYANTRTAWCRTNLGHQKRWYYRQQVSTKRRCSDNRYDLSHGSRSWRNLPCQNCKGWRSGSLADCKRTAQVGPVWAEQARGQTSRTGSVHERPRNSGGR